MDDCDLEKLSVKPGSLKPKFHRNTTEYSVTVASDVSNLTINSLTSDSNACYQILGSDGSRTIPLKEGDVTTIKLEVSAEDGTTKVYQIHAKRLSAKDASLASIKLSTGSWQPEFESEVLEYTSIVPSCTSSVKITPTVLDKKTATKVCGNDPGLEVNLNVGETPVDIEVTSADGTNKQVYSIKIARKWLCQGVSFTDQALAMKYECPITLGPFYKPVSIIGSDPKHIFTEPLIDEMTRTSKQDPLDGTPLEVEWKKRECGVDAEMSGVTVQCVYQYAGCQEKVKFSDLSHHAKECSHKPQLEDDVTGEFDTCKDCSRKLLKTETDWHKATMCTSKFTDREMKHSVKEHSWEKRLSGQSVGETNIDKLVAEAKKHLQAYKDGLPKHGQIGRHHDGKPPLECLQDAAINIAAAIKNKPKQADLHFQLGMILEEQYYAEDMFGLKKEDNDLDAEFEGLTVGTGQSAKDSSKEDDIQAICMQRGAGANAPLSRQLQAIDEEFKHLLDSGQSGKSDYVQSLYIWKSKQATQDGKAAQAASDQEAPLGKAYLKYMDALSLDQNNTLYNIHVGRLMLLQGNAENAIQRLQLAVGLKPTFILARFYLGLALALQKNGAGSRSAEAAVYIHDGVQHILQLSIAEAETDKESNGDHLLHAEDLWRQSNIQLLRGFVQLGGILKKMPKDKYMIAKDVFHSGAILASMNLCSLVHRGDTYQSMQWILLDCHANLLEILQDTQPGNTAWISQRCHRLSALIHSLTLPKSIEILTLQEKTCQKGVIAQPWNSQALCQLGVAQLAMYDNNPDGAKQALQEAQLAFRASIEQEGKASVGGDIPQQLTKQIWWQEKLKKEKEKKESAEKAKAPVKGQPAAGRGRGAPASRGRGAPARGAPARGGPAKAAPARGANTRGASTARGGPAKTTRGGVSSRGTKAAPLAKTSSATKATATKPVSNSKTAPTAAAVSDKDNKSSDVSPSVPIPANAPLNRITYPARLGLARVLSRETEDLTESEMLYNDVITMAPQLHDAYIELGDLMIKNSPLKSVDVYARYPFQETSSFDDAYLHGEIVRLLMKHEQFDDPRLQKHMIEWGRVMGIGCLEKYVDILDGKFKTDILKNVYAGVNHKSVDDTDMQAFFKFKMWL